MQICPKCGIGNEDSRSYCLRCGVNLPPPSAAGPGMTAEPGSRPADIPPRSMYTPSAHPPLPQSAVSEVEMERFLAGFSWGPGCSFYLFSRAMLFFLLGAVTLNLIGKILEVSAAVFDAATASLAASFGLMISGLLLIAAIFGLMIWAGKVARRRRWNILNWRDFEHYKADEETWNIMGIVGWVLTVLILILSFIAEIMP